MEQAVPAGEAARLHSYPGLLYPIDISPSKDKLSYTHFHLRAQYCLSMKTGERFFHPNEGINEDIWCHIPEVKEDDCTAISAEMQSFIESSWELHEKDSIAQKTRP